MTVSNRPLFGITLRRQWHLYIIFVGGAGFSSGSSSLYPGRGVSGAIFSGAGPDGGRYCAAADIGPIGGTGMVCVGNGQLSGV